MWRVELYIGSFYGSYPWTLLDDEFVDYSAASSARQHYEEAYGTEVRIVWTPDLNRKQEPLIIRWQEVGF